jgi:asparagine synthase (glutamine-hydrolysing)
MSGICAVLCKENGAPITEMLAQVAGGLSLAAEERAQRLVDGKAGLAVSARFRTQQSYHNARVLLVCDAQLYNEKELRPQAAGLEAAAENCRTGALLTGLYERLGCDFVAQLRGSFSLILWDRRQKLLLSAVDGFGMNRLTYYEDGSYLLVATRIDALMQSGRIDAEINPRAIVNVLNFSANLGPETVFTGISRVQPGHLLTASDGATHIRKYWDMRYGTSDDGDESRLSRKLESIVEQSVAAHCRDDDFRNLGSFLSGGTDSSTVVGMMSRLRRGPVNAFSIGFQEQSFDELAYARIAARRFHAEHHTYLVSAADCAEALPRMIRSFDEPFGNSSAIPTYFCARLAAAQGVQALLAGDGGDELFGGNERYRDDQIFAMYHAVPRVLRQRLLEPALARVPVPGALWRKARGYVRRANMPGMERMMSFQFMVTHSAGEIFEDGFLEALGNYHVLDVPSRYYAEAPARDHLDRILYADVKITLGDSDLPKVTCMSELAGIQTRFPFLDRFVAEFSGCIPARLKVKGFQKRYLFKKAFGNLLPPEILAKKKHGFGIPVAPWLKSDRRLREWSRDVLFSQRSFERGYFRRAFIEDLVRKHEADDSTYYGDTLWSFFVLELWHRQFVDEPAKVAAL